MKICKIIPIFALVLTLSGGVLWAEPIDFKTLNQIMNRLGSVETSMKIIAHMDRKFVEMINDKSTENVDYVIELTWRLSGYLREEKHSTVDDYGDRLNEFRRNINEYDPDILGAQPVQGPKNLRIVNVN